MSSELTFENFLTHENFSPHPPPRPLKSAESTRFACLYRAGVETRRQALQILGLRDAENLRRCPEMVRGFSRERARMSRFSACRSCVLWCVLQCVAVCCSACCVRMSRFLLHRERPALSLSLSLSDCIHAPKRNVCTRSLRSKRSDARLSVQQDITSLAAQRHGHLPQKSPIISVSFAKNDLQLKAREVMCKRSDARDARLSVQQHITSLAALHLSCCTERHASILLHITSLALSCRSFFTKGTLIIRLFCGK